MLKEKIFFRIIVLVIILDLSQKNDIKSLLQKQGFVFKKSLGQNFLIDSSVSPRMAEFSCGSDTGVIEIGPGAGVLTRELSKRAKRVVTIELDEKLKPILDKTLEDLSNVTVIFADVLKCDLKKIIAENFNDCKEVSICANLPYYITSPVIMKLIKDKLPIKKITVMVQKEAADRICACVGSRDSGAITAAINYYAVAKPLFFVPKESFLPAPKVNSEVICLEVREKPPVKVHDEAFFFKTVNACFHLRRKTALNSISSALGIDKQVLKENFVKLGISETARGETFNMETLARLAEEIKNTCKI